MNRADAHRDGGSFACTFGRRAAIAIAAATLGLPTLASAQDAARPAEGLGDEQPRLRYLLSTGETGFWEQPGRKGEPFVVNYAPAAAGAGAPTFNIEYLDVTNTTGVGFDDPALGATRRDTVGAVIAYLQKIIMDTGTADIVFNESQTDGMGFLATAGPLFPNPGDACVDPLTVSHIITNNDPFPNDPDGTSTVDFGYNYNSGLGAPTGSETDLYSVILHELTHALGFLASIGCNSPAGIDTRFKNWDPFMEESGAAFITCPDANFAGADVTGDLTLNHPLVNTAWQALGNAGSPPLYAPDPCVGGSSISHWNTSDPNMPFLAVMGHSIGQGEAKRLYQPLDTAALAMLKYSVIGTQGACCLCDGMCIEVLEADCLAMDEQYFTEGVSCVNVTCEPVVGPTIVGQVSVCPGTSGLVYTITNPNPNATYTWGITGDGSIIGPNIGTSVTVNASFACNGGFDLTVVCASGNCVTGGAVAVTVADTEDPVITAFPQDMTVECDGAGNAADVAAFLGQAFTATDNCPTNLQLTFPTCVLSDGCGATGSCTATWQATDGCNTVGVTRIFTIEDTTPPMIECPGKLIVSCADGPPPPNTNLVTASDACGNVVVTHVSDVDSNPGCPRVVTRTYRATDECDLFSECTQTIYVDRLHPGWNWVDNGITLTANEPTYWSALTGDPKGLSPFTVLDPGFPPGRPAMDGTEDRVLRGYVIGWAVDQNGDEIKWNHLKGEGTIINYRDTLAWEYNTWNHAVVSGVDHGDLTGEPGVLRLDGLEYALSFDELLLNFQAAGSDGFSNGLAGFMVESDTDLTLYPPGADLRQNNDGPVTTKASMDIWNENETKFSGTHRCITCWDQTLISRYDVPNSFLYPFLQTDHGKARIDGHAADDCDVLDDPDTPEDESVTSILSPLLGVYARLLEINGVATAASGSNLIGMGMDATAVIQYDAGNGDPPPEGQLPTDPHELIDWLVELAKGKTAPPTPSRAQSSVKAPMSLAGPFQDRVSGTEKGSLVFFSKVEIRWDKECELFQDTILSLTNDFPEDVRVQLYFVNGDAPITATPDDP